MRFKTLCGALLALALTGCATAPPEVPIFSASDMLRRSTQANPLRADVAANVPEAYPGPIAPTIVKGSDVMIGTPSARGAVSLRGEAVTLRFEQAPVTEVVHAVFGDLLKLDYVVLTPLTGEISLATQAPVPRDQVLPLLETALSANGISMVADLAGRYQIGSSEALRGTAPRRVTALAAGGGSVIVPLRYIGAIEMADILRPVASADSLLRVDPTRNLLMLSGTRQQLDGWLEIINTFDVDFLKGMSVGLFPITHSSVAEVDAAIKAVLGTGAMGSLPSDAAPGSTSRQGEAAGVAASSASAPSGGEFAGPLQGLIRVVPIERLNALLVITPRAHYLEQARSWIERFDQPASSNVEGQLYVYPVQNGSAQHLARLLSSLYGDAGDSAASTTSTAQSGLAPSLASSMQGNSTASTRGRTSALGTAGFGTMGAGSATDTGQGGAVTQVTLERGVKVIADDHNNALLIHAPRSEYRRIESALRRLDVAPTQVLIEASIIEVTLTDMLKYGLQWYFQGRLGGGGWQGQGQLGQGANGAIAPSASGFVYSMVNSDGAIRAVLSALADKSLLNVLSNPNVMVLDNHTATIQVGDQQPIQAASTLSENGDLRTTSIEYKDTGVLLTVTPSVNAGDMVTMTVDQSITDVGDQDVATGQRSFNQRQINSRVAVRSGQTVMLGGLIRDNKVRSRQGIPLLHDIPYIGNLFGTTTIDTVRTELMVLITPRVIRSGHDVVQVSSEMRERLGLLRNAEGLAGEEFFRLMPERGAGVVVKEAMGVEQPPKALPEPAK